MITFCRANAEHKCQFSNCLLASQDVINEKMLSLQTGPCLPKIEMSNDLCASYLQMLFAIIMPGKRLEISKRMKMTVVFLSRSGGSSPLYSLAVIFSFLR